MRAFHLSTVQQAKKSHPGKDGGKLDYQTRFIGGMNSIAKTSSPVNGYSAKCTNLTLTSGAKVKRRKFATPPPPEPILHIGKYVSLDLTLREFGIAPNAATAAKIGGAK